MANNVVTTPDYTTVIDNRFLLEPLGGPSHPQSYLDRFPEEVYNTSIDSRLVKFIYSFMGPSGIGWLQKNYLQARLIIDELGLETFDLEKFYGNPLSFGRIVEEIYDDDPDGLLSREAWSRIKARDAQYRNRAIDFINGARMGNTPAGMHLVARSGLGHEVEIIENYRYLYDQYSDDPLDLDYYGATRSTEEMIVLPRRDVPHSEAQIVQIDGEPTGGTFRLFFPMGNEAQNTTGTIPYNVDSYTLQQYLEALASIAPGDIRCIGGPLPDEPIRIEFQGNLSARDVPELVPSSQLTGGTLPLVLVITDVGGVSSVSEIVSIPPRDMRHLQSALDRIKPVTTIPTMGDAAGLQQHQIWNSISTSSTFTQVVRYVTGASTVSWPARDKYHWIEANVEHEGLQPRAEISQHYQGFHRPASLNASTEHIGPFLPHQVILFPFLHSNQDPTYIYRAANALAYTTEPLTVSATTEDGTQTFVNGIYPTDYQSLPGVSVLTPSTETFWASKESNDPNEMLLIDLGEAKAVNYVIFELSKKPVGVTIDYDVADLGDGYQDWREATYRTDLPFSLGATFDLQSSNPWQANEVSFTHLGNNMIFTRFIRLTFTRRDDPGSPFVSPDGVTKLPYSIEVRNLRVGRNVV